ncbi:ring-infected erythrocyte surface antigen domain-containing protein [Clostridium tagluense]|uniref:hypothetical protein n=1 Tax=Clostridium tagluense TaxID=360422 RepID=UPI001C0DDEFA|nr:hypothetical protein [Clostridium tagluense]MBU3126995.1 hypothetical protein [Clostridium tagluense]MCB2310996.1 hypothetical protein [Clostridium tagluense]MCB2321764.1 hypothetical protein [Clostridium tagluense]MCB2325678.1 hypothetical protein [Clostridium tagluense]MCB2331446.1 hypothetical protein [Clostridium tagluense]
MSIISNIAIQQNPQAKKAFSKISFEAGETFNARIVGTDQEKGEVSLKLLDGWQFSAKIDKPLQQAPEGKVLKFEVEGFENDKLKIKLVYEDKEGKTIDTEGLEAFSKGDTPGTDKSDAVLFGKMIKHDMSLTKDNIIDIKNLVDFKEKISLNSNKEEIFIARYLESRNIDPNSEKGNETTKILKNFFEALKNLDIDDILLFKENNIEITKGNLDSFIKLFKGESTVYNNLKDISNYFLNSDTDKNTLKNIQDSKVSVGLNNFIDLDESSKESTNLEFKSSTETKTVQLPNSNGKIVDKTQNPDNVRPNNNLKGIVNLINKELKNLDVNYRVLNSTIKTLELDKNIEFNAYFGIDENVKPGKTLELDKNIELSKGFGIDENIKPGKTLELDKNIELSKGFRIDENIKPDKNLGLDKNIEFSKGFGIDENIKPGKTLELNRNLELNIENGIDKNIKLENIKFDSSTIKAMVDKIFKVEQIFLSPDSYVKLIENLEAKLNIAKNESISVKLESIVPNEELSLNANILQKDKPDEVELTTKSAINTKANGYGKNNSLNEIINMIKKELNISEVEKGIINNVEKDIEKITTDFLIKEQIKLKTEEIKNIVRDLIENKLNLKPETYEKVMGLFHEKLNDLKMFNSISEQYYYLDLPINVKDDEYQFKLIIKDDRKKGKKIDSKNVKIATSVKTINMGTVDAYIKINNNNMNIDINCDKFWVKVLKLGKEKLIKDLSNLNYRVNIEVNNKAKEFTLANCGEFFDDRSFNTLNIKV